MENVLKATQWIATASDQKRKYIYEFVKQAERDQWGYLDLAARFHVKSLSMTYSGIIQEIIKNPEVTIGLFSFKNDLARSFMKQIKREFEINEDLQDLFDDILYKEPQKQAFKWSEKDGILVKRKGNPNELTLEAVGLIDGKSTGMHFKILWFDDAIEKTAASTAYQMQKAEESIRLAIGGLGTHDKVYGGVGTRWRMNDAYENLEKSGVFKIRLTKCTSDQTTDGTPLYMTQDELQEVKKQFTTYQFNCQMFQSPIADSAKRFKPEWLRYYKHAELKTTENMNKYILVDPANSKKRTSDYTAMVVIGLSADGNYYVLDAVLDKLGMDERIEKIFHLVAKWGPLKVGYERYGMQVDVEQIKKRQAAEGFHFSIVELGGKIGKEDRIEGLMPLFEQNKLYLPDKLLYTNWEKSVVDVIDYFVNEEYLVFPMGAHDDMIDAMARIVDPVMNAIRPAYAKGKPTSYSSDNRTRYNTSWMSA